MVKHVILWKLKDEVADKAVVKRGSRTSLSRRCWWRRYRGRPSGESDAAEYDKMSA